VSTGSSTLKTRFGRGVHGVEGAGGVQGEEDRRQEVVGESTREPSRARLGRTITGLVCGTETSFQGG